MTALWTRSLLVLALICPSSGLLAQQATPVEFHGFPLDWWRNETTGPAHMGTAFFNRLERDFPKRQTLPTIDSRAWRALLTAGYEPIGLVQINVEVWDSARVVRKLLEQARDKGGDLIVFPADRAPHGRDELHPRLQVKEERQTGRCLVYLPPIAKDSPRMCNVFETKMVEFTYVALAAMVFRLEPALAKARFAVLSAGFGTEEVLAAAHRRDTTVLRRARDAGVDVSAALKVAVDSNYIDLARWLLRRGVAPALVWNAAAVQGRIEILTVLLEGNISAEQLDQMLIRAAIGGSPAAIRLLLDRGARVDVDPKHSDYYGSALMNAVAAQRDRPAALESVRALLAAGANPNWVFHKVVEYVNWSSPAYDNASTALAVATYVGDSTLVKVLLERGANPALKGKGGRSALEISARSMKGQLGSLNREGASAVADGVIAKMLRAK
jgi:hypothetical protein